MKHETLAKKIILELKKQGYQAYYAGGFVRDLLRGVSCDDIDIATSASPEEVQKIFPHTIDVGKEFGSVVVVVQGIGFEVTTFRRDLDCDGRRPGHIDFCDAKEDALRRDFTVNGMFFDPLSEQVIDYVGGTVDLEQRMIRAIGSPNERFLEDRLRMLRAVRFSVTLDFSIEQTTFEAIQKHAHSLMSHVAIERVWKEWVKMVKNIDLFIRGLDLLHKSGLFNEIFPLHLSQFARNSIELIDLVFLITQELKPFDYILLLFAQSSYEVIHQLHVLFKLSRQEGKDLQEFLQCRNLVLKHREGSIKEDSYVEAFALSEFDKYFEIVLTNYSKKEALLIQEQIKSKQKNLEFYTELKKNKKSLVSSQDLISLGILPGPLMGHYLKMAEKIAIEHKFKDKNSILEILKRDRISR